NRDETVRLACHRRKFFSACNCDKGAQREGGPVTTAFCAIKTIHCSGSRCGGVDGHMLVANTSDWIRSHLSYFPPRRTSRWNGSESWARLAGCSTQRAFLEFFVYPPIVYVAHREARRCADFCGLLHHRDHRRQPDCPVEGTRASRGPGSTGAGIRATPQNIA